MTTSESIGVQPEMKLQAPTRLRPEFASDAKRSIAARLFAEGLGYRKVSALIGVPLYTVRDWRRQYAAGSFNETLNPRTYRYPDDFKAKVVAIRRSGVSWKRLKALTGVSSATCRQWMQKMAPDGAPLTAESGD